MTAQIHEQLILEGKPTSMTFCPPIPRDHPQIPYQNDEEVRAGIAAGEINRMVYSTACWRGYVGTWEMKDGKFYLVKIMGAYKMLSSEPIFADWVTAVIRIPDGEMLNYVHMGFGSVYEFETHLKIENGLVVDERRIDNRNSDLNRGQLGRLDRFDGDDW
jgi:hypothetical protein